MSRRPGPPRTIRPPSGHPAGPTARCAACGLDHEAWALLESLHGPLCILCRLRALGRKARRVAALCPEVPWPALLRLLLPRPTKGWIGNAAGDAWRRAAHTPIAALAQTVRAAFQTEQEARMTPNPRPTVVIEEWEEGWIEAVLDGEPLFEGCAWDTEGVLALLEALGVPATHLLHAADPQATA